MTKKQIQTEFVAFSDHHAHNFQYKAQRKRHPELPGFYNSRLLESAAVLREIKQYCLERELPAVFGGDLFHRRSVLPTDAWNVTYHELEDWCDLLMIPGNHDYADNAGNITSLDSLQDLSKGRKVSKYVGITELRGTAFITVPYTYDITVAREYLKDAAEYADRSSAHTKVLLCHLGMQGAKVGSDYVLVNPNDIEVDDVAYSKFTLCLFGHFHQHQKIFKNGYYIGATHAHNWGDANTVRGFLHVTIYTDGTYDLEQIETSSPKFISLNEDNAGDYAASPNDFVKYKKKRGEKTTMKLPDFVEVVDAPPEEDALEFSGEDLTLENAIDPWVNETVESEDTAKILKALGARLLASAESELL